MNERVHLRAAQLTETPRVGGTGSLSTSAPAIALPTGTRRESHLSRDAHDARSGSASVKGVSGTPPTEESLSPTKVQHMFGESRDIVNTRNYRKWRSMKARNFSDFYRDHQSTFLRRMRRGVPQKYRWEVWKVVTGLETVLKAETAQIVLQYLPQEPPHHGNSSAAKDLLLSSYNSSSSDTASKSLGGEDESVSVTLGHVSRQELELLAPTITPAKLFDVLCSKPSKFASLIDIDLNRTFPEITLFDTNVQKSLHAILNAYANFAPHVGYCQGMNFVMGFILLVSNFAPDVETFWFFVILMSKYNLHGFFREGFPLLGVYISTFDEMIDFYASDLRQHFAQESVLPPVYLHQWYLTLFVTSLPLGTVVVIWDFILCNNLSALLPLTVALLKVLQSFLMRLRFEGIVKFLKSLRLSGDCDEGKIGKMLVKHADCYPIPERLLPNVTDVDFAKLLEEVCKNRTSFRKTRQETSLVDFDSIMAESAPNAPNPLNAAMQDQGLTADDEDDEEDQQHAALRESALSPAGITKESNKAKQRHEVAPTQTESSSRAAGSGGGGGGLSKRFLPKVIGRKT